MRSQPFWREVEDCRFYSVTARGYKFKKQAGCSYVGPYAIYLGPLKVARRTRISHRRTGRASRFLRRGPSTGGRGFGDNPDRIRSEAAFATLCGAWEQARPRSTTSCIQLVINLTGTRSPVTGQPQARTGCAIYTPTRSRDPHCSLWHARQGRPKARDDRSRGRWG